MAKHEFHDDAIADFGPCSTDHRHEHAASFITAEDQQTHELRTTFLCPGCVYAHSCIEAAALLVGTVMGHQDDADQMRIFLQAITMANSVSNDVAIEMLEAELDRNPREQLREALRVLRNHENTINIEPITANDFAALMARTNTTNPQDEEIN